MEGVRKREGEKVRREFEGKKKGREGGREGGRLRVEEGNL